MTKKEIKQFAKENHINLKNNDFVVEYTTRLTNDVEYDICKHWFEKWFKDFDQAKAFFDEVASKYYNVSLKTWVGNSIVYLDDCDSWENWK